MIICLALPVWHHKIAYVRLLKQVEEAGLELEELLKLGLRNKTLQVVLAVPINVLGDAALQRRVHEGRLVTPTSLIQVVRLLMLLWCCLLDERLRQQ